MERGVRNAAVVSAAIGATLAVVEGVLMIALGSLGGLADNPEGEAALTGGYVVLALGAVVLAFVFVARGRPLVLALVTALAAAIGFGVENALWIFVAVFLFAAAAFAVISRRGEHRLANRNT